MDSPLPPGWQQFSNPNGQVIYANVSTGQVRYTLPVAAAALALPPGWTQMTNDIGRTVYINQSRNLMKYDFPQAEAEQAQAPSAPPVDPRTEEVKTQYYPHVYPFSRIAPADIIDMLYHPQSSPDLTPDEIDLIINNYVGTAINGRRTICGEDADILSCAKKLFSNNATTAQRKYSFKLPIVRAYYECDVPLGFRWNPDNGSKQPHTAFLSIRLFPLNDNTVRWLCSTHTTPIPTMREALENKFMLDFFDGPTFMSSGKTAIQSAIDIRDYMSTLQFTKQQAIDAEQERKRAEEDRKSDVQQRILSWQKQQKQAKEDAAAREAVFEGMRGHRGGLKGRRRQQSKANASKRKQTKRKQSRRRS
jgi:hypothetical protein